MKKILCLIGIHDWVVVREGKGRFTDTNRDCYIVWKKCKNCHKLEMEAE